MSKARYITGLRAVEQLLAGDTAQVRRICVEYRSANPRVEALVAQAREKGIDVQEANRARLKQMSGEVRHQGVVAEVRRSTQLDEAGLRTLVESRLGDGGQPLLLLVLDGIQDPHNLGACLRTADAAEHLPFAAVANIGRVLDWFADYGITRIGTSDRVSQSLYEVTLDGHLALVMGREETGLGKAVSARCDQLVSLPMAGRVSSLNVSVATGICLYETLRQRR